MIRFLIDPDRLSVFPDPDNPGRYSLSYCGVAVPGLSVPSDADACWELECHLDELSAHERLALIGRFLDARFGASK